MLIPIKELVSNYNLKPSGVLHIGGHIGEEAAEYEKYCWTPVIWVEAQPDLALDLKNRLNPQSNTVINAAIYDQDMLKIPMFIASNSQSSSLLKFGTHKNSYPEISMVKEIVVYTKRLDSLFVKIPNFINLDIQGVELKAIKSLGELISQIEYVYTEVNRFNVYEQCDLISEVDTFLISHGFRRVATRWKWLDGWGDALYVRVSHKKSSSFQIIKIYVSLGFFYKSQIKKIVRLLITKPSVLKKRK